MTSLSIVTFERFNFFCDKLILEIFDDSEAGFIYNWVIRHRVKRGE